MKCHNRVSTENWGSMGWGHLIKGGMGEIKKGSPEEAATKLRPERGAGVGQAKRGLNNVERIAYKGPEAKESFCFFAFP